MKTNIIFKLAILLLCSCYTLKSFSQSAGTKTVIAGKEYKRSGLHTMLWGKNYRKEWAQPVEVKVLELDTAAGGLKAEKEGGGHQSKSLHLTTKDGKTYTIRTVNKTLSKVLPESFQKTFIEKMANDKVSMSHPYSALAVPYLAEKASVLHTNPQFVYVPAQPRLDTFSKEYGDKFYLFEQRASGDWRSADNLGNFEKYIGTDKVLENIMGDNDMQVDQFAFARSRLFDMLIGDWDRHEDQWKWGTVDKGKMKWYVPVPSDRDQAFSRHDGLLLNLAFAASGIKYMQSFSNNIKDVTGLNFEQRGIDRIFTNKLTIEDWQGIAKAMQQSLSDTVIETSIKQIPANVFSISGNDIISKLKSRRNHLEDYATEYSRFLAKEVEIVGSKENERFEVNENNNETEVKIFKITKQGYDKEKPFYKRTFKAGETKEIRLFGVSGNDVYLIDGENKGIRVRVIGGNEKDSINVDIQSRRNVHIYDNYDNVFGSHTAEIHPKFNKRQDFAKLHLTNDTTVHEYKYKSYVYDKKGIGPVGGYTYLDRFYVGLGYQATHHAWRKEPFVSKQKMGVNYSLSQKAFSVFYGGFFAHVFGKTDLVVNGYYDDIVWTHYYGLGNETGSAIEDINFYRMRSHQAYGSVGVHRGWSKFNVTLSAFYNSVKIKNDEDRFVSKSLSFREPDLFKMKSFGGLQLDYSIHQLNDSVLPVKGFIFSSGASYTQNLTQTSKSFEKLWANLNLFVPLVSKFSLALKAGGSTVLGTPEFYQNVSIGGPNTLRGYRLERFWGKSAFYNTNELQFISKVKSYVYSGKAGLLAFFDDGRVWIPNETSNTWHTAYGGGIILAPFNAVAAVITYGISTERSIVHIRINKFF